MNIVYITRHFNHSGYEILKALIENNIEIQSVVLHTERSFSHTDIGHLVSLLYYRMKCFWYRCEPIKNTNRESALAKKNNIPILYIDTIHSEKVFHDIKQIKPDLIVLGGGWHELLPERIFSLPRLGCINTHPSLLPEFRGTSIHRWQILHGVRNSGVTIHYVNSQFDAGEILVSESIEVEKDTTPQDLFIKISRKAAELMPRLLLKFAAHGRQPTVKRDGNPKYCKYFSKWSWNQNALRINWSNPLREIYFQVLANTQESYEFAGPWFLWKGRRFILRRCRIHGKENVETSNRTDSSDDDDVIVCAINEDSIYLSKTNDLDILELVLIQRDDRFRKLRRAKPASSLSVKAGERFA